MHENIGQRIHFRTRNDFFQENQSQRSLPAISATFILRNFNRYFSAFFIAEILCPRCSEQRRNESRRCSLPFGRNRRMRRSRIPSPHHIRMSSLVTPCWRKPEEVEIRFSMIVVKCDSVSEICISIFDDPWSVMRRWIIRKRPDGTFRQRHSETQQERERRMSFQMQDLSNRLGH